MTHIFSNTEIPRSNFGDSPQLTNWILDSGATFHVTTDISVFILESMVETDKYIEVTDGSFSQQNKQEKSK